MAQNMQMTLVDWQHSLLFYPPDLQLEVDRTKLWGLPLEEIVESSRVIGLKMSREVFRALENP